MPSSWRWCSAAGLAATMLVTLACGRTRDGAGSPSLSSSPASAPASTIPAAAPPTATGAAAPSQGALAGRAAIVAALRDRRFAELEAYLSRLAEQAAADPARYELEASNAFEAFRTADPELDPLLDAWIVANRESPIPELARGIHYEARGWQARGGQWARETPDASFVEMRRWFEKAAVDGWSAVRHRGRLADGWSLLIGLHNGNPRKCVEIARQGLEQLPASFRIRARLENCLRPRWGGSYEAMSSIARDAQSQAARNPNLRWLLGFEAEDRSDVAYLDKNYDLAAKWADQALAEGGEYASFLLARAYVRRARGATTEALADVDLGLQRWPDDTKLRERRIAFLVALGRDEEARAALAGLAAIDPVSRDVTFWRERLLRGTVQACESLVRSASYPEAIARCNEALAANPADAESSYWLGRAYLKMGDDLHAQPAFEAALRANPRHREAIRNLDYIFLKRREFDRVLALWNAYLTLEPADAQAMLERAGTQRHRGDVAAACRDLKKACELGSSEACNLARAHC